MIRLLLVGFLKILPEEGLVSGARKKASENHPIKMMRIHLLCALLMIQLHTYGIIDGFVVVMTPPPRASSQMIGRRTRSALSVSRSTPPPSSSSSTSLFFRNETTSSTASALTETTIPFKLPSPFFFTKEQRRQKLKTQLAVAAIEEYDMEAFNANGASSDSSSNDRPTAEDLMRELEQVRPWKNPARSDQLNARWSFVFTGVPTIGMRLITLLSRIAVACSSSLLQFDKVYLEVSHQQSQVKAIVSVHVWNQPDPLELHVYTRLEPNITADSSTAEESSSSGTVLIETFDRVELLGYEIPTPASWKQSRRLEITYLDEDMMIARTGEGGEPHLLLRHSSCSTDVVVLPIEQEDQEEECNLDDEDHLTPFYETALEKYGPYLSRSLVDRAFSSSNPDEQYLDLKSILQQLYGIFVRPNH